MDSVMFGSDDGRMRRCSMPSASAAPGRPSTGSKSMMFMNSTQKNTSSAIGATNLDFWWKASLTWPSTNSVQTSTKFCQPLGTPLLARRAIGQNRNTNTRPNSTEKNIESMFSTQKFWEFSTIFQLLRSSWRYVRWCRMYAPLVWGASAAMSFLEPVSSSIEPQGQHVGRHDHTRADQRGRQRQLRSHQDQVEPPQHDHPFQQHSDREAPKRRFATTRPWHKYAQGKQRGSKCHHQPAAPGGHGGMETLHEKQQPGDGGRRQLRRDHSRGQPATGGYGVVHVSLPGWPDAAKTSRPSLRMIAASAFAPQAETARFQPVTARDVQPFRLPVAHPAGGLCRRPCARRNRRWR